MSQLVQLTDEISYLPATRNPLSCDIVIIKPKTSDVTWIYDVGCSKESRELINSISGTKFIVLSHFHPDHILNLPFIKMKEGDYLFVSKNTKKYTFKGTQVQGQDVSKIDASKEPQIFELPSSHAKGCLCLLYKDYCFMGDGTYCKEIPHHHSYNEQLLKAEIDVLEQIPCKFLCLDHDPKFVYEKDEIITLHKQIYSRRVLGSANISVEDFFNPDGSVKQDYKG